jgi:hypothetical protein
MSNEEIKQKKELLFNRDIELQKIQAFERYFRMRLNAWYSLFVSFLVGIVFFIGTLYYQDKFNIFPSDTYGFIGTLVNIAIFGVVLYGAGYFLKKTYLDKIIALNDKFLELVEELIAKVEKDEKVPSMTELKKKVKIIK